MTGIPSVPGAINVTVLTGTEVVPIAVLGPRAAQTTTGAIAQLAVTDTPFVSTNITTVGNGTLTAAALVGDIIVRTGPTGAFTDTTDTAANIIAAFPSGAPLNVANEVLIKNATAFPMTIAAGTGVTLPATVIIPPFMSTIYAVQITSATAVTFIHMGTNAISAPGALAVPALTALTTVGAGTILAAAFAGGLLARSGTQAAGFTDTTDTAVNIIAACSALVGKVGAGQMFRYVNNTTGAGGFPATITGGTGVTVSGITVVPANSWADFLITEATATTLTMVGVAQGYLPNSGTVTANAATPVVVANAAVTPGSNIILTYKSGSVGATGAFVEASVPGTSFSIKSVTSDTAVYNYTILG
jgi:hypothetical protein